MTDETISYVAKLEPEEGGYVVTFPDLPGCITQGDTIKEVREMAKDALSLYLSTFVEEGKEFPEARYRLRNDLKTVRQERITIDLSDLVQE